MKLYSILISYIVCIVLSNVLTAKFQPLFISFFIIPYGTFFISFNFIIRDYLQKIIGKTKIYFLIVFSMFISGAISFLLEDTLTVAIVSVVAFLISEIIDTEVYSKLKKNFPEKVLISGLFGGFFDSVIFVIFALSPIGLNYIKWDEVILSIFTQLLVKYLIHFVFYVVYKIKELKNE